MGSGQPLHRIVHCWLQYLHVSPLFQETAVRKYLPPFLVLVSCFTCDKLKSFGLFFLLAKVSVVMLLMFVAYENVTSHLRNQNNGKMF